MSNPYEDLDYLREKQRAAKQEAQPEAAPARTLSDFIRNATPEEKEAVYLEVMDKATARQLETMAAPQEQRANGVPGTYKDVTGESNG